MFARACQVTCLVRDVLSFVAGQVLFSTDELKKKVGIPTKADWAERYNVPMEGPLPPGAPEYDPLLGAGQYNSEALLAVTEKCCPIPIPHK